jgi:Cu/Ag efflux protein CusF
MKTAAALIAASLILATLSGAALAQSGTTAPAAPAAPATPAAPAAKPAEPVKPAAKATDAAKTVAPKMKAKMLTGEVVSVDAAGKTVTVKRTVKGKAEEMTIGTGEKTAAILDTLKAGDQIRVAYADVDGKPVASTIAKVVKKSK